MAELTNAQKQEIDRLRFQHPDYKAMLPEWEFYLLAYEGGPKYVTNKTLFKHQREHIDDYNDRLARAYYANYCQALVDFVPEFIFSQGVRRTPPKDMAETYESFRKDVDRSGSALDTFMEEVAEESRIFGHTWVGIDKLQAPEGEEISKAKAEEMGLTVPYFYHVRPTEILDWVTDQFGNYLYVKRREYYWEKVGKRGHFRHIERYTEWEPTSIVISKIDITEGEDEGTLKLMPKKKQDNVWNLIPFVQFFYKRSKINKDFGVSFLTDLAYQNRAVFNQTSYLEEFLARQCFNVLAMEVDTAVPTRDRADGRIGTSNILFVPKAAEHMPEYVSPPIDPAEFIQSERANTVKEMYRQAAQDILAEIFSGGKSPSGDAQKQTFQRTIPMIAKMAEMMQTGEHTLWSVWSKLQDKEWEGGVIAYRDDYSMTNIQDLLLALATIFNSLKIFSPTFIREEWRRVIREFDGKIPGEVMTKILAEIEAISDQELIDGYKLAADPAAAGLPSTSNLIQGKAQKSLGSDKNISLATGNKASSKEANPDKNKRSTPAKGKAKLK